MSFLNANYSNNESATTYGPLPTGEYEMIINKAQETATKNGAESFQIDLIVRNDLDGVPALAETNKKYHNRHVFNDNWKRKATGQYDMQGFQYILQAVGVPEGTTIATIDDFARLLVGKPVKVYVKEEDNEYNGTVTKVNRVAPWNYSQTAFPNVAHVSKDKNVADPFPQNATGMTDAEIESNLPF